MQQLACHRMVLLLVLALGAALASSEALRQPPSAFVEGSRHRRSLLSATQQISQCDWLPGEGCALHPAYASYALNRSSDDVVAQYVSNALACATATDKGLCESASYCYWDPSFSNGQQGCFMHEDSLLSLQLRCVQSQYQPSLTKLQACMAARQSCQCSSSSSSGSSSSLKASCTQRQQQVLSGYGGRAKVCSSLLGCWLASLNSSSVDVTQLVETQLLVVQPKIELLSSSSSSGAGVAGVSSSGGSSTTGGRRRALQQIPPSLSDPVLDDKSGAGGDGYMPESGSYGPGGSSSGVAGTPSVGMNGVVTDDQAANEATATTPVENGNNVPAPSKANGSANSNTSLPGGGLQLESGSVSGSDWTLEQATLDPDQVFGSGSGSSGAAAGGSSGSSADGAAGVQMTGGNAPKSFWQCAAEAAVKADTTRKWADVDYNSKSLTLATWIKVIQPTSLIDWGVQVLECFKTEVPQLNNLDASSSNTSSGSATHKPNKESLEFAIVALIRAFTGHAEAFRTYLQAGASADRSSAGLGALSKLSREVLPGQLAAIAAKQQSSPAYQRDVMLQAAAVITDMQWFSTDVLSLARSSGDATPQQEAFEAYITYAEETARRCLYWLFHLAFDGAPVHLPGPIPSSAASAAVVSALDGLAASALPAPLIAADSPAWQQLQVMTATAAGAAAAAAAESGDAADPDLFLSNTVLGLAKAHVQDLWGSRLELARNGAPEAARALALRNPNEKSARWEPLRKQQVLMLSALQERAALGRSDAANARLSSSLQELVAASGAYLLTSSSADAAAQEQKQRELSGALGMSAQLAALVRQCYGSPAGLPALTAAAAAKAGVPAQRGDACAALATQTDQMAAVGVPAGIISATLRSDLERQWRCNALPTATCSTTNGCAVALAPILVPGAVSTAAPGSAADNITLACQAADAHLLLSSLDSNSKTALAVGSTCEQFLRLPACEAVGTAAGCRSSSTCRWEASGQRNVLHTAAAPAGANGAASTVAATDGSKGVCAMDWVAVLSSTGGGAAYNSLNSMVQLCSGIGDSGQCESQTMLITLDAPAPGNNASMARFWVPALVVAGVAGVLLFGAAIWWRRSSAAARRAADEARAAAGGGRGGRRGGGKDGKGGKGAKGAKKKVKRAEPGSYKPDLMRDSFTDYMRAAPQQFNNGVAIAKAAMATGDLDTAVAVADVAGGRQLGGGGGSGGAPRSPSPGSEGSWGLGVGAAGIAGAGSGSQGSTDLIDLAQSDASGHGGSGSLAADQGSMLPSGGYSSSGVGVGGLQAQQQQGAVAAGGSAQQHNSPNNTASRGIWGSAAAAAGMGPELVSPRGLGFGAGGLHTNSISPNGGLGGRGAPPGGLQGDMSVPVNLLDAAGASMALTSSINLVSSLPQHSSLPIGFASAADQQQLAQQIHQMEMAEAGAAAAAAGGQHQHQQQAAGLSAGAARALFGASSSLARISGNSLASSAYAGRNSGGFDSANSGALLLPVASRGVGAAAAGGAGDDDGGSNTPTSSCCHDSVCTFGPGPGSVVSNSSGGRPRMPPHGSQQAPRAGAAAAGGSAGGAAGSLSAAPSVPLSRSSWSSAMSTDMLMQTQASSVVLDP